MRKLSHKTVKEFGEVTKLINGRGGTEQIPKLKIAFSYSSASRVRA